MKKHLSLLSTAVMLALSTSASAVVITDSEGDQKVTGDQEYSQVFAIKGGTLTFTEANLLTVDNRTHQLQNSPAFIAQNGGTINFGTEESKLGTISVKAKEYSETDTDPSHYWTGYIKEGTVNVNADKYEQTGSVHGIYVLGTNGVSSVLNLNVDQFDSTTGATALHVREGEGAVINVGSIDDPLTSFKATRTIEDSGVSLLQANEGGTINVYSDKIKLQAFNSKVGGGALGSGSWGTINLVGNEIVINGSIDGDYGGTSASKVGDVFAVNITANLLKLTGDIHAGSDGTNDDSPSLAYNRKEAFKIEATDPNSTIKGDLVAYNKSSTVINFVNGGTFTGDITTNNYTTEGHKTTSSVELAGTMNYIGAIKLEGSSKLNLSGNIHADQSTIISEESSLVSVGAQSDFKTVTSTSTAGVAISDGATLKVNEDESAITNLTNNGTLYVAGEAKANIDSLNGTATIKVDSLANTVNIGTLLGADSSVSALGSGTFNDSFANSSEAIPQLLKVVTISDDGSSLSSVAVEQGLVNDAVTADVDENGQLFNVRTTKNTNLASYGSIAVLGAFLWRHDMNDLTKRMGELRDSPQGVGVWARAYGSEQEYGGVDATNTSIQVGADYDVGYGWKVGGAFTYTDGSSDFSNGNAEHDSYGFAVYGSWLSENGQFVDLIAKYSRLDTDFAVNGMNGSYDNNAWSISAEYGWRFKLAELAFVEPQVELTYGTLFGDDITASNGVRIEQDDFTSFIGRIGVRSGFYFPEKKGNIYARFSVLHDFDGEMESKASLGRARNTVTDDLGGTWVEYGVGANFNWTDRTYTYVDLERNSGGEVRENWRWNVGLRHVF